jgi:hypothetical protein
VALGYGLDDRRFESRQGLGIFLFTTVSRTVLGPTQPPIEWVPGALSLGLKRPGREADFIIIIIIIIITITEITTVTSVQLLASFKVGYRIVKCKMFSFDSRMFGATCCCGCS